MYSTYGFYIVEYIDQSGCRENETIEGFSAHSVRRQFIYTHNPVQIIRVYRIK